MLFIVTVVVPSLHSNVLPIHQRPQIVQQLTNSSSSLFLPVLSETKQKKLSAGLRSKQVNARKHLPSEERQASGQRIPVSDHQWTDCIRSIISNSLQNEIKLLLEKYQLTYFDRVNAPNTSETTIRINLCEMVSQILSTYSTSSSTTATTNTTDLSSAIASSNNNAKRKRESTDTYSCDSCSLLSTNRSNFVISSIIPGKHTNKTMKNPSISIQRYQQFQKKYTHLFHYVPDDDVQSHLIDQSYWKMNSHSSNSEICLMLYDEVITYMDEDDLQISGISLDQSFPLSSSIVQRIHSCSH